MRYLLAAALLLSACGRKPKPAPESVDWPGLISRVASKGGPRSISTPTSLLLGFDNSVVPARALRLPSRLSGDGKEHAVYVVGASSAPTDVVLFVSQVVPFLDAQHVQSLKIRVDPAGERVISAVRAKGPIGRVMDLYENPKSTEVARAFELEKRLYLSLDSLDRLAP